MTITVTMAAFLFLANGQMQLHHTAQMPPGLDPNAALAMCWKAADAWVKKDPDDFNALSLGAGCVVERSTRS